MPTACAASNIARKSSSPATLGLLSTETLTAAARASRGESSRRTPTLPAEGIQRSSVPATESDLNDTYIAEHCVSPAVARETRSLEDAELAHLIVDPDTPPSI